MICTRRCIDWYRLYSIMHFRNLSKNISQVKHKIRELSTGNQNVEEWTFLPEDWPYRLNTHSVLFARNFVLLKFFTYLSLGTWERRNTDDLMILNLITRKPYWMETRIIETQVKEKVAGQMDLSDFVMTGSEPIDMFVVDKGAIIEYKIVMDEQRIFGEEIKLG